MAVRTYRLGAGQDGNFGALFEADQTAASRADGWTVGKIAASNQSDFDAGTKQATGSFAVSAKPASFLTGATANAFKTPAPLTGQFAATAWTVTFAVRAVVLSAQAGRMRLRVFKSVNADGSGATELTGATQVGTTSAVLSTTADVTTVVTWSPGAFILSNEYLFFVLAWEITTVSGSNTADVVLRTGQAAAGTRIVTADLGAIPSQNVAVQGLSSAVSAYASQVLADTPIAYYRLNEAGGTGAIDSSGNARNGTYVGSPALAQAGAIAGNTAALFDGVDDQIDLPSSVVIPLPSGITVEWWQYVATSDLKTAFAFSFNGAPERAAAHAPLNDQNVYWDYGGSGPGRVSTSYAAYLDKWTHVCLTFDPATNTHAITLDGTQVASVVDAVKPSVGLAGGCFGDLPAFGGYNHKGIVDEVAIYDKALPPDRRLAHFNARVASTAALFGVPSAGITVPATPAPVTGLASAQNFGAPTIKTTVSKPAGGVSTAQSFGVPTIKGAISRAAGGVSSAQAFGAPTVTGKGALQTVLVSGVIPSGYVPTIVDTFVVDDGHVVDGIGAQFGTPNVVFTPKTVTVNGVPSAQAFGVLAPKTAISRAVGGVSSAQAFGTPTFTVKGPLQVVPVPGLPQVTGLPSITGGVISGDGHVVGGSGGLFGWPTFTSGGRSILPTGLGSAQSFGTVTVTGAISKPTGGVPSAQAFGVPVVTTLGGLPQTVPVPGLQQVGAVISITGSVIAGDGHLVGGMGGGLFGTPTFRGALTVQVPGLQQVGATPSITGSVIAGDGHVVGGAEGGLFGRPTFAGSLIVQVPGLPQSTGDASITGEVISGDGHVVGGTGGLFGRPSFVLGSAPSGPLGVPSAQQFGAITIAQDIKGVVPGVPSAQKFGKPRVYIVWVRPFVCTDLDLVLSTCTDLVFVPGAEETLTVGPGIVETIDLTAATTEDLELQPAGCA